MQLHVVAEGCVICKAASPETFGYTLVCLKHVASRDKKVHLGCSYSWKA